MNILFVCTGNTCRSPMAELIFKDMTKNYDDIFCDSAGISTINGMKISQNSFEVLKELGIDASGKTSKSIFTIEKLDNIDLFVVMTVEHAKLLLDMKIPSEKIYILSGGIPDPYGLDINEYRNTMYSIKEGLECLLNKIKSNE